MLAARHEPEVGAAVETGDASHRRGTAELVSVLGAKGALRGDLDETEAAERLWLLTGVEQAIAAIDTLGWTFDHCEESLGNLVERELLSCGPVGDPSDGRTRATKSPSSACDAQRRQVIRSLIQTTSARLSLPA